MIEQPAWLAPVVNRGGVLVQLKPHRLSAGQQQRRWCVGSERCWSESLDATVSSHGSGNHFAGCAVLWTVAGFTVRRYNVLRRAGRDDWRGRGDGGRGSIDRARDRGEEISTNRRGDRGPAVERNRIQVPDSFGKRKDGRKRGPGPKDDPWLENQPQKKVEMQTLERPMMQDLLDTLDAGAARATREGRDASEGVQDVLTEAAILASKGVINPKGKNAKTVEKEIKYTTKLRSATTLMPHYRRAHDWSDGKGGDPNAPPDTFFSKKTWDDVFSVMGDVVDLAETLELPRPSRIQNMVYHDIAQGRHTVIADQAGSGKTLAYLLPLLQRHVLTPHLEEDKDGNPDEHYVKLVIVAPTTDLAEQIRDVVRVVAKRGAPVSSAWYMRVECCTGGRPIYHQKEKLRRGVDVMIATPGRLADLLGRAREDGTSEKGDWLRRCGALVLDEVDVLVKEPAPITVDELRQGTPTTCQWVFVTATLGEAARDCLSAFEALPFVTLPKTKKKKGQKLERGLAWHTGPGLHRVSNKCEHVVVDATPKGLYKKQSEDRHPAVMKDKVAALAWHLRYGVLRELEENRIVLFCNTIENCRTVENELRKVDETDQRTGSRRWKTLVLHGQRSKEDYEQIIEEFRSDTVNARDFFKKKILVCTDRLSRGIDFSQNQINWVVLFDWPRDATEYLRRVGRTCRGGENGGALSLVAGLTELKMARMITSAAIRGVPLQAGMKGDAEAALEALQKNTNCLERFDPRVKDWRSPEASARKELPRAKQDEIDEKERQEYRWKAQEDTRQYWDSDEGANALKRAYSNRPRHQANSSVYFEDEDGGEDDEEGVEADREWKPWQDKNSDGKAAKPWEEGDEEWTEEDAKIAQYSSGDSLGVSLYD